MAEVDLINVTKRFGTTEVVHGVDLRIHDSEFVVLVGPSGCGKSTILRMIAGLESLSDGEIRIADRTVNQVPPKERNVAMVFQNYALYPHMTVYDNMGFSLKMQNRPMEERDKKVRAAADILELTPVLDRTPAALSGGHSGTFVYVSADFVASSSSDWGSAPDPEVFLNQRRQGTR